MISGRRTLLAVACLAAACGDASRPLPEAAQPQIPAMLRSAEELPLDPSDGQGRAWLVAEGSDIPATASQPGSWEIGFEAGPAGIAVGGAVYLQVSPFWGWSTPQVVDPQAPGYTTIELESAAGGVELEPRTLDQQLLGITVRGAPLSGGDKIRIRYGAGSAGAFADRFAESESRFWIAVDGNGDGRRSVLRESPVVEVEAGAASRLLVHLPSSVRPHESIRMTLAVTDRAGNRATGFTGIVEIETDADLAGCPEVVEFLVAHRGARELACRAPERGVVRVVAKAAGGIEGFSNPLVISEARRILWADFHGHSGLSDGTGTPSDYLSYAREVAALDAVALTDHDHWGVEPLATHPDLWREIGSEIELANEPGRFVALRGFEWTSWLYGHRHVLFFSDRGKVLSSLAREYERPQQLWDALEGQQALTIAHHSAGGPIATDWRSAPDSTLEPVTEIVSVHGSSESADSPFPIYQPRSENFVRDALAKGYQLGFVGSGDSHDGHPGLAHLASPRGGGLAAVLAEDLTRASMLEALRTRRVYATNGPRIVLRASLAGRVMGSLIAPQSTAELEVQVAGAAALASIQVVRNGMIADEMDCSGSLECEARVSVENLASDEYLYVRVLQQDGAAAWSSPFFVE